MWLPCRIMLRKRTYSRWVLPRNLISTFSVNVPSGLCNLLPSTSTSTSTKHPRDYSITSTFTTTTAIMTPPHHYDSYWRLDTYEDTSILALRSDLEAKGLTFEDGASKEELVEVQQRLDRGLLIYDERITSQELSKFVQDRQLRSTSGTRKSMRSRKNMIAVLMAADDGLSFDKFGQLPAELRESILKFHFKSLPADKHCTFTTQPPVTRASKLLRTQALPIFHGFMSFGLNFFLATDGYNDGDDISKARLRPCFATSLFLQSLSSSIRLDRIQIWIGIASLQEISLSKEKNIIATHLFELDRTSGVRKHTAQLMPSASASLRAKHRDAYIREFQHPSACIPVDQSFRVQDVYLFRKFLETAFL